MSSTDQGGVSGAAPASAMLPWRGMVAYLGLTFLLAWVPAILLDQIWDGIRGLFPTSLLAASAFYALTMGWQPFLAVWIVRRWIDPPGYLDHGLRPAPPALLVLGTVVSLLLTGASMLIASLAGPLDLAGSSVAVAAVPEAVPPTPSWSAAGALALAFAGTVVLVSVQAFSEELGWRGYFLVRLMQQLGPWPGLLLHGVVWGAWYAPVVLLASGDPESGWVAGLTFVVTCALLGALLGWLRLAGRSLLLAVLANAVLTIAAGLPFILRGMDVGTRSAAYGPAGWIPLLLTLGVLFTGPTRRAIVTPLGGEASPRASGLWRLLEQVISRNGSGRPRER
jgi:membrane protease YdiL (CAAX protease family)